MVVNESDLAGRLESFLAEQLGGAVKVTELTLLPGGASRETWSLTISEPSGSRRLVLRRDPPGSKSRPSLDRTSEFDLLRRTETAGVPVPRALWISSDPGVLGAPGYLMDHVAGETIPRRILRQPELAEARRNMATQCGEILARIHAVDYDGLSLSTPDGDPALAAVEQYQSLLDAFGEPHPALELGLRRLRQAMPAPARTTLVHGDFRHGNFIVGPDGIRAILDWELAHAGDPWEDLGWLCVRAWRFKGEGEVGGFGSRQDLYSAYERTSGIPVDADAVTWWEALGTIKWGVICVAQAFTHLLGQVRSVELAAIGRRACEPEYDLLHLLALGA